MHCLFNYPLAVSLSDCPLAAYLTDALPIDADLLRRWGRDGDGQYRGKESERDDDATGGVQCSSSRRFVVVISGEETMYLIAVIAQAVRLAVKGGSV